MFKDRNDAGHQLAELLDDHDIVADVVLAIPRGGLPVGRVVADKLDIPLDIVVARKLGAPSNPELAVGSVASDGTVWLNEDIIDQLNISDTYIDKQIEKEHARAAKKYERYRGDRADQELLGKRVLLVDDGIATGATTRAVINQLQERDVAEVILAVPVAPPDTVERLRSEADRIICVRTPPDFRAVGQFFERFEQVTDEEAKSQLR